MDDKNFALLIDADNISAKYVKLILDELTKYGNVTYKRVYGDLTRSNNRAWKDALLAHSINPVQQYNYTTGKNSTDSAMIIDAMDILYSGHVDGFALASSDSDFTRLAVRLRESGMTVIGMGESKTPKPFQVSCERFVFLDLVSDDSLDEAPSELSQTEVADAKKEDPVTSLPVIENTIIKIISDNGVNATSMDIGELGSRITKFYPSFDIRNYGYTKFSKFLEQFHSLRLDYGETGVTALLCETTLSLESIETTAISILEATPKKSLNIGELNRRLLKEYPDFNIQNYGYTRLTKMLQEFKGLRVGALNSVSLATKTKEPVTKTKLRETLPTKKKSI